MLKTRIFTALVGIPVIIFFAYLGGFWYSLLIFVIAAIGLREYFYLIKKSRSGVSELLSYLLLPFLFLSAFSGNSHLVLLSWVLIFIAFSLLPVLFHSYVEYKESIFSFWGTLYTGGLAGFLLAVRFLPKGFILTLFLFLMVWSEDILAYFIGSMWGKTPLAPGISPKKTLEGTFAGIAGSVLVGLLFYYYAPESPNLSVCLCLGLIIGITATFGDLGQSAFKRSVGAKDSGHLLPGHGGILDRFDSLFFAAPFFYFYIIYFVF
ncbi:MAG: phosphatidate cytidylyltransferase [Firmicutes bacterium]|nr:phosphatidate cytidylyltransferase [Bacillota bacterium]